MRVRPVPLRFIRVIAAAARRNRGPQRAVCSATTRTSRRPVATSVIAAHCTVTPLPSAWRMVASPGEAPGGQPRPPLGLYVERAAGDDHEDRAAQKRGARASDEPDRGRRREPELRYRR
jgi:hypothetical protein